MRLIGSGNYKRQHKQQRQQQHMYRRQPMAPSARALSMVESSGPTQRSDNSSWIGFLLRPTCWTQQQQQPGVLCVVSCLCDQLPMLASSCNGMLLKPTCPTFSGRDLAAAAVVSHLVACMPCGMLEGAGCIAGSLRLCVAFF
jgi:hypothetical protein